MDSDDFTRMQASLSAVLDLLLPEMPPSLQPFPIQDDRLLSDVLVQLGGTDLLHCGSGYQSAFSIGLRIARVLGEVSRGVKPRLLVVAIEEPEAHLHPHKQRHLVSALQQLQQQMLERHGLRIQILITTHSSNILSGLSSEQVVILRTKAGVTQPTKLDHGDDHDLSGLDASRVRQTTFADFEWEILAVLPLERVLRAVAATLTDGELDGLYKHLTSPVGVPGLSTAGTWDDVVQLVGNDQLSAEDLMKLKSICRDYEVSRHQKRGLLKGADIGALLAEEADTVSEIPPVYWDALQTAQRAAREIMDYK